MEIINALVRYLSDQAYEWCTDLRYTLNKIGITDDEIRYLGYGDWLD
jgi:predicted DCC family thiol-disulfide oxidoreductase YuxK